MHQPAFERHAVVPFRHMLGEIAHQRRRIDFAEQRWRFAHGDSTRTEAVQHQTIFRQFVGARNETLDIAFVEFDDFRNQQDLSRNTLLRHRRFQPLIDQPLMRGMLIDDDKTIAGLRHDVIVMHLRTRGAKRTIERIDRRLEGLDARTRGRCADIEHRLGGFGKAERRIAIGCKSRLRRSRNERGRR